MSPLLTPVWLLGLDPDFPLSLSLASWPGLAPWCRLHSAPRGIVLGLRWQTLSGEVLGVALAGVWEGGGHAPCPVGDGGIAVAGN